jgi:hypothetical protein
LGTENSNPEIADIILFSVSTFKRAKTYWVLCTCSFGFWVIFYLNLIIYQNSIFLDSIVFHAVIFMRKSMNMLRIC